MVMGPNVAFVVCLVSVAMTAVTSGSRGGHVSHRNARGGPAVVSAGRSPQRTVKFENFDEYLRNIGNEVIKSTMAPHQAPAPHSKPRGPSDDVDYITGSGDDRTDDRTTPRPDERRPDPPSPAYDLDILGYFRDVPRQHWSCCMLGKLAGDKGFHCYAGFYAARIQARNLNRAHNKKMHFHGHDAIPDYGTDLMHTFQRCVATHGDEFHKCCYAATIERQERHKWSRYAVQAQVERQEEVQEEVQEEIYEERREVQEDRSGTGRRQGQRQRQQHQQQSQHGHHSRVNRPVLTPHTV